jgi:hypothetical protein
LEPGHRYAAALTDAELNAIAAGGRDDAAEGLKACLFSATAVCREVHANGDQSA